MRKAIFVNSLQTVNGWNDMSTRNVKETRVYKLAFELTMEIFEVTKNFPKEEKYSLTDQVRRSSRSVCICLIEAYRKKKYELHFEGKVGDSDMKNPETYAWFDFYLSLIFLYNKRVPHLCATLEFSISNA